MGSLVILDYKTGAVPAGAVPARTGFDSPHMNAYTEALTRALSEDIEAAVPLFLAPTTAVSERVIIPGIASP